MTENKTRAEVHVLFVDDEADVIKTDIARYSGALVKGNEVEWRENIFYFHYERSLDRALTTLKFGLHRVDLVVIDYLFPEEQHNGFWLLDKLSKMSPDIPAIVLTSAYRPGVAFDAGSLKADAFLEKGAFIDREWPERLERLLEEIVRQVARKRDQPELHDRTHLSLADAYADHGYDSEEQSYPATLAYYLFENEKILNLVERLRGAKSGVDICDIGCGTGRIEELLLRQYDFERDDLRVTAVDFSGRMLKRLVDKGLHAEDDRFRTIRASAERLDVLDESSFDLVILGFGVPSYTRYHLSLREAARLCRPGGFALFSVYNAESVAYDIEKRAGAEWSPAERSVAAMAIRETGKLNVGGERVFDCETFTAEAFARLLVRTGFELISTNTFPTLYVSVKRSDVARMPDAGTPVPGFPLARDFSPTLYELDHSLSEAVSDRGHYIVFCARRRNTEDPTP